MMARGGLPGGLRDGATLMLTLPSRAQAAPGRRDDDGDPSRAAQPQVFAFNDRWIAGCCARLPSGYDRYHAGPGPALHRQRVHQPGTPGVALNQLLQGKPKRALEDFTRFLVNSTVGLGGAIRCRPGQRPATHTKRTSARRLPSGAWAGAVSHAAVPRPGDTGHAVGMVLDAFTNPLMLVSPRGTRAPPWRSTSSIPVPACCPAMRWCQRRSLSVFRDAYQQRREYLILDGQIEDDPFLDDFDDRLGVTTGSRMVPLSSPRGLE
jgi:phospholipid-binding lipoprotein MlaA